MTDDLNNNQQPTDRRARAEAYADASRAQRQAPAPQGTVANNVVSTVPTTTAPAPTAAAKAASKPKGTKTSKPKKAKGTNASDGAVGANGAAATAKRGIGKIAVIVAIIVVACIAVVAAGIWWFGGENQNFYDSAATSGQAPYKTDEEIQAELSRVVEEGMLNISIASVIEFEDGASEGVAYIENVPSNKYVMKAEITLDDTGETVYQSGGIRPNNYIESITLTKDLDAGSYPATATFTAYDPDTLEEVGQAAAKVTLSVEN